MLVSQFPPLRMIGMILAEVFTFGGVGVKMVFATIFIVVVTELIFLAIANIVVNYLFHIALCKNVLTLMGFSLRKQ
jgi:hypothetical protein